MTDLSDKQMLSRIARALKANSARLAAETLRPAAAAAKKKTPAKRTAAKTLARKRKSA